MTDERHYRAPVDGAHAMICSRCVMDSSVPEIAFDSQGECNYCKLHDDLDRDFPNDARGTQILQDLVAKVKQSRGGQPYDCVIGVSGGTDSTYLAHLARELGLNPLAVHLDCGWDTQIAVSNIKNSLDKLGIDLYTWVVDWQEMKDLYRSCLRAAIPWPDGPTDTAILGSLYATAAKHGIKYIFVGNNFRSEGRQPTAWTDFDGRILNSIHKRFGTVRRKTFPHFTMWRMLYYGILRGIKLIRPFYYIPYNKTETKKMLTERYAWKDYGGHHHESVFTRYVIGVWLPNKFAIDKRKVALSAQVRSGEFTRAAALETLGGPAYDPQQMKQDEEYLVKKLSFSPEEFRAILAAPNRRHTDYPNYSYYYDNLSGLAEFVFRFILPWKPMMFYRLKQK